MTTSLARKFASFGFAAIVTLTIMSSLDALATSGQSAEALLAQQGKLQVACTVDGGKV